MSMIFVFITCPNRSEAKKISLHLLKAKLVACTQIFPIDSSYWWKNKIKHAKEWMIIAKSVGNNFSRIKTHVKKLHSYKVPEIVMIDAKADERYARWIVTLE